MTEKEFRRLHRADLLEIIHALQENELKLQKENAALREQLEARSIAVGKADSLEQASIQMESLFEEACKAASQFLNLAKAKAEKENESFAMENAQTETGSPDDEAMKDQIGQSASFQEMWE